MDLFQFLPYLRDIVSKVMDDGGGEEELKQKKYFKKRCQSLCQLLVHVSCLKRNFSIIGNNWLKNRYLKARVDGSYILTDIKTYLLKYQTTISILRGGACAP